MRPARGSAAASSGAPELASGALQAPAIEAATAKQASTRGHLRARGLDAAARAALSLSLRAFARLSIRAASLRSAQGSLERAAQERSGPGAWSGRARVLCSAASLRA